MRESLVRGAAAAVVAISIHGCKGKSGATSSEGGVAATGTGANPLSMLSGFEGEIDLAIKDMSKHRPAPDVVPISLQIKNDKVRAELPQAVASKEMPKGHIVLSAPDKKLFIVMDEQKQIVVIDLNKAGEQLKSFSQNVPKSPKDKSEGPSNPPPKVTKTGVVDKVAGIACENWDVSEESRKIATFCIADQGASWFHLPLTGIPTEYAWALELMDGKHFPLRMIGYDKKTGAEEGRVELTKLEKKTIASTLFDMPPGYKVVDMGAMLAGLAGAPGFGAAPGAPPMAGLAAPGAHPKKTK